MIYDCFTFFNELELLELRLNILNDVVDKFVIVEAAKTHAGVDKPLNFLSNKDKFSKFSDKIIYIQYDEFPPYENPWIYENLQRNAISEGLKNCKDDDIIIISDLDEIISPKAIKKGIKNINEGAAIKKFKQYHMNYYLNVLNLKQPFWYHPKMCTYKTFKSVFDNLDYEYSEYVVEEANQGTTATKIRMYSDCDIITDGGWHFSFTGGAERIFYKINNYAHQECVEYIDSTMEKIANHLKMINENNDSDELTALRYSMLPEYLKRNIDKYKDFISKTPEPKLRSLKDLELKPEFKKRYKPLEYIFSVKNENKYKVLTVFGKKFNFISEKNRIKHEYYKKLDEISKKIMPKKKLTNFEVHLTEHCNLNCQCCNHFSPLAESKFADLSSMEKDLLRLAELTHSDVDFINLLGGEPLLNPDLISFFEITRKYFPKSKINLVSNGILLTRQDENFWKSCQNNNITICVTKYSIDIDWRKIEAKANQYERKIFYWNNNDILKHSWHFPLDLTGSQNMAMNFLNCEDSNSCIFLRDGKLFTCVVPPNIHHFNKYFNKNLEVTGKDYIDIYEAKNIDEILNFLASPIPFCRYCNVKERKYNLPWKISKKEIKEWT